MTFFCIDEALWLMSGSLSPCPCRCEQVASFVSPVPIFDPQGKLGPSGGGPMTLPMLLHSTLANAT